MVIAEVDRAIANLDKTQKQTDKTGLSFKDFAKQVAGYTTAAGLAVEVTKKILTTFGKLGEEAITLAAGFETAKVSWGVLLGDVQEGEIMFNKIFALAAKTPLSFEAVEQGARTLSQYGIASEEVIPIIKMLGDISMGNAEKLRGLSIVYGQVMSTGRLMGQDLLQLINQGFNPLQVISKKTGESIAELKKRMEAGGISANEVAEAFKTVTSEGGLFYQMMDKTAETTAGKWTTAQDNFKAQLADLGENVIPVVNLALDGFNIIMEKISENAAKKSMGKIISESLKTGMVSMGEIKATLDSAGLSYDDFINQVVAARDAISHQIFQGAKGKELESLKEQSAILTGIIMKVKDRAGYEARLAAQAEKDRKAAKERLEKAQEAAKKAAEIANLGGQNVGPWLGELEDNIVASTSAIREWGGELEDQMNPLNDLVLELREWTGELEDQTEATREWPELLSKQDQAWQDYIANLEAATEQYNAQIELADAWQEAFSSAWLGVGEALAEGESGWVAIGEAAKDAFAKILQGLAAELAARSALALLKGQFGKAAAAAAASATTYVAAGAIQAMAEGGEGTVTKPTLFLAGEAGPEDFSFVPKSKGGMKGSGNTVVNQYTVYNVGGTLVSERAMKNTVRQMASSRGF